MINAAYSLTPPLYYQSVVGEKIIISFEIFPHSIVLLWKAEAENSNIIFMFTAPN